MLSHPLPQGKRVTERAAHAASNPDFATLNPGYAIATAHSQFARRVRWIGMARQGGVGRDVDDRAAAPAAHMRCDLLNPKETAGQIDRCLLRLNSLFLKDGVSSFVTLAVFHQ